MTKPHRLDSLVVAILTEAREQGRAKLLKTALVKFVYLADVYAAREDAERRTITRLPWRFLHYGPYAQEVEASVRRLEEQRAVHVERARLQRLEESEDEGGYQLIMLPNGARSLRFSEITVPKSVGLHLAADIRRYGGSLPRLLSYVYFSTEPMKGAMPGGQLDFSDCEPLRPEDFHHPEGKPLPKKRLEKARKRLQELADSRKQKRAANENLFGPYDATYLAGMEYLNDEDDASKFEGTAEVVGLKQHTDG